MSGNSRYSTIGGIPVEAIAKVVTMQYDTVNPLDTRISFAYRNYALNADGQPVAELGDTYDLVDLRLGDILDWDFGPGVATVADVLAGIRAATDLAHNKRAEAQSNGI